MKHSPLKQYKPLQRRTPLRAKTPLKSYVGLKSRNPMKRMSVKAQCELEVWMKVKRERIEKLIAKFDFVPCEYCHKAIAANVEDGMMYSDAHHNNHDRRDNSLGNQRICHPYCNRIAIEDNYVKDVPSLL